MSFHHTKTYSLVSNIAGLLGRSAAFLLLMTMSFLPLAPVFAAETERWCHGGCGGR